MQPMLLMTSNVSWGLRVSRIIQYLFYVQGDYSYCAKRGLRHFFAAQVVKQSDAGKAIKISLNHSCYEVKLMASCTDCDFDTAADREAINVDVIYRLDDMVKRLAARCSLEVGAYFF